MAFTDIELAASQRELRKFLELRRPPVQIRSKLDIGYRICGQSVELFEIRPTFLDPTIRQETPVAKSTFVRSRGCWRVFWMRRDLRWHGYPPAPEVASIADFLSIVNDDEFGCFFG